MQVDTTAVMT